MAKTNTFVDPDYDKRLLEFKARRDQLKKEMEEEKKEIRRN